MSDFLPKECDIVMEGGVTSGVVYPAFVARLAERFTLRSIGGTSVGAVAAIAAAAAQFKRNRVRKEGEGVDDGFHQLARLPGQLQESVDDIGQVIDERAIRTLDHHVRFTRPFELDIATHQIG